MRLTCCGGDVDVNAKIGNAAPLQRRHARVRAEVCELEVDDVQVGGSGRNIGVRLGDNHSLGAPQGAAVLQPAECQLLGWRRLHLEHTARSLSGPLKVTVFQKSYICDKSFKEKQVVFQALWLFLLRSSAPSFANSVLF